MEFFEINLEKLNQSQHALDAEKMDTIENDEVFVTRNELQTVKCDLKNEFKIYIENLFLSQTEKSRAEQKSTFVKWSERILINCYRKIFEYENYFVKLFWLLILLSSLSVTAWLLISISSCDIL